MSKLVILQTCAPDYRKKVYSIISEELENEFELLSGDDYFESSVKTDFSTPNLRIVKNHYLFGRKFLFQTGIWKSVSTASVVVMEMNPRVISNWIILLIRKLLNRKVVVWGHAWPRSGPNSKSDIIRNWMRVLADVIIVYTNSQKKELQSKMPSAIVFAAPNAVMTKKEISPLILSANEVNNIIYVGRLTRGKKILFLINTFIQNISGFPKECNLLIVGDGEELSEIKTKVLESQLEERIILYGHISDYSVLKELYASSFCSVSPGYVGLSITQSLGMGVPMLVSKNENHSPEIEAVVEGENGLYFESNDYESFMNRVSQLIENNETWYSKRNQIAEGCKMNYSVDIMAQTFLDLVE